MDPSSHIKCVFHFLPDEFMRRVPDEKPDRPGRAARGPDGGRRTTGFRIGASFYNGTVVGVLLLLRCPHRLRHGRGLCTSVDNSGPVVRFQGRHRVRITSGIGVGAFVGPLIISRLMIQYGWRMTLLMVNMTAMGIIVLGAQLLRSPSTDSGRVSRIVHNRGRLSEDASFKEALRSSAFWVVFLIFACCGFVVFAVIVHIIPYAIELEIGIPEASATLSVLAICSVFGKILMRMASDVIGNKKSCGIGFVLITGSLLGMVCSETLNPLCGFAGLFGFAYGAIIASESPLIVSLFGLKAHGSILGAVSTEYTSGGAVGPFLMGMLFDVTGDYGWGFFVLTMTALLGTVLTYRLFP